MATPVIQLDSSFLIRALVPGSNADRTLRAWLAQGRHLAMSTIAWTELVCGPLDATDRSLAEQIVTRRIPNGDREAAAAAELFNDRGRRRGSLIDCMIAAAARVRGEPLPTLKVDDFRRFESLGLQLAAFDGGEPDSGVGDEADADKDGPSD